MIDYSKITVIYGPQGSGKTRNAAAFAKRYGCKRIIEVDDVAARHTRLREGDLLLTNEEARRNKGFRYIHINQALQEAGIGARA